VGDKQTTRPPAPARVIVGVSGGIACYKVAQVVSKLVQSEVEVTVAMTDGATRFVTPLTFQALSGRPVYSSQWTHIESHDPQHINLARSADVMLIAPATMDMLARLAHGRTDDVVSLIASAVDWARQPLLLAPSMNEVMWRQPSTQRNLSQLRADGVRVIEPTKGWQACRTVGMGRLAPPEVIIGEVMSALGARARGNG
jgi:phosphopantothenoylcysteine decarboxylase/phosphopantothenate--cysteine ligase